MGRSTAANCKHRSSEGKAQVHRTWGAALTHAVAAVASHVEEHLLHLLVGPAQVIVPAAPDAAYYNFVLLPKTSDPQDSCSCPPFQLTTHPST